jgi:hypothetical protein
MGNAITPEARFVWLMLRRDGGWWSASSLTHYWRPTFCQGELTAMLDALRAGNFIEQREQFGLKSFCVTSSCTPLPGVTV